MVPRSALATIRLATVNDLTALVKLCAELGYPADESTIDARLKKVLADTSCALFVSCTGDGGPVGFVHVGIRPLMVADRVAEICGLVVTESVRGQGHGKRLMLAAEDWARRNGCAEVSLRSNIVREEAHAFYRGLGYTVYKTSLAFRKPIAADRSE